jgi:electron transfer flavoprotein alpha subunit
MPLVDAVLVLADSDTDDESHTFPHATRELLTAARRIGTPVVARLADASGLEELTDLVRRAAPRAVLITHDARGEETAARLAVRLESGLVTDVTGVSFGGGRLHAVQDVAAGACRIATHLRGLTPVITVRRGAFGAQDPATASRVVRLADLPEATDSRSHSGFADPTSASDLFGSQGEAVPGGARVPRAARVLSRRPKRETGRDLRLDTADVVVAGGRGVGSAEGFSLLARVAKALDACLGGTHTSCELGWCPEHARISQPGAQIRPRLYLAGGVSGSLRHRAAIRRAHTVVAIDRDPAAPILREADLGIVGDLHEVLPALLGELARRRTRQGRGPQRQTDPSELAEA